MEGATSFTGSDSYWKDEELLETFPSCEVGTMPWEFPIWISPIAVIFNLDGISSLNMDGATVAASLLAKSQCGTIQQSPLQTRRSSS